MYQKLDLSCASPKPVEVTDGPITGTVAEWEPDRVGLLRCKLHSMVDGLPDDAVGDAVQMLVNLTMGE